MFRAVSSVYFELVRLQGTTHDPAPGMKKEFRHHAMHHDVQLVACNTRTIEPRCPQFHEYECDYSYKQSLHDCIT